MAIQARLSETSRLNCRDLDPFAVSDSIPHEILLLFTFFAEPRSVQNICWAVTTSVRTPALLSKADFRGPYRKER